MKSWVSIIAVTGMLSGGCQILAGVRTDAELIPGAGGAAGAGGAGGAGGATTTDTGGAGGGGGCQSKDDCPGAVCLVGACVTPVCEPRSDPEDIFLPADLDDHLFFTDPRVLVAYDGRVHVVLTDQDQPRLLARTWSPDGAEPLSPVVEVDLSGVGFDYSSLRFENGLRAYGRVGDQVGELPFPSQPNIQPPGVFSPYPTLPAECLAPSFPHGPLFDHAGGKTRYLVTCPGQNGKNTLVIGAEDQPGEVVVSEDLGIGPPTYRTRADGTQFAFYSQGGGTSYRAGVTAADLQQLRELRVTDDPEQKTLLLDATLEPTGEALAVLVASVNDSMFEGSLWGGFVKDVADLESVPPPGLAELSNISNLPSFNQLSRLLARPSGYFLAIRLAFEPGIRLLWLDTDLTQFLTTDAVVFDLPAGDDGQIFDIHLWQADVPGPEQQMLVTWVELRAGKMSLRGRRMGCSF